MSSRVIQISSGFHILRETLARIEEASDATSDEAWETITELIRDRMSKLSREIVEVEAASPEELAHKASIVMDWLETEGADLAEQLAASLCRDVLRAFPISVQGLPQPRND